MPLRFENVNTFYDQQQVLFDVSLEIRDGEIVSLIGANGSGKSTIFKTITGIVQPKSGKIYFDGKRIDRLSPWEISELGIALSPEERRLFSNLTVKENLKIGGYVSEKRGKGKNFETVYEYFPRLKERENQLAGTLSGGEQQMLSIGRVLMMNPDFLLIDEVSLGLMPKIVDQLYEVINKINSDGVSILLAEQSLEKNLEVADRVYVLRKGRIEYESPTKDAQLETVRKEYFGR